MVEKFLTDERVRQNAAKFCRPVTVTSMANVSKVYIAFEIPYTTYIEQLPYVPLQG